MIDLNTWIYCNIFNIIHTKKKGKILFCHRVDDFSPFDTLLRWCKICTAREADYFKLWWSLGYYTFCFIFLAAIGKFAIFSYLSTCQNVCVILDLYLIFFFTSTNSLFSWLMSHHDSSWTDASKSWVTEVTWFEYRNSYST